MKPSFLIICILFIYFASNAQNVEFSKTYLDDATILLNQMNLITPMSNGDMLMAGSYRDSSNLYVGWNIIKVNAKGDTLFFRKVGLYDLLGGRYNEFSIEDIDYIDTSNAGKYIFDKITMNSTGDSADFIRVTMDSAGGDIKHLSFQIPTDTFKHVQWQSVKKIPGKGYMFGSATGNILTLLLVDSNGKAIWSRSISDVLKLDNCITAFDNNNYLIAFNTENKKLGKVGLKLLQMDNTGKILKSKLFDSLPMYLNNSSIIKHYNSKLTITGTHFIKKSVNLNLGYVSILKMDTSLDSVFWKDVILQPDSGGGPISINVLYNLEILNTGDVAVCWYSNYERTNIFKYMNFFSILDQYGNLLSTRILDSFTKDKIRMVNFAITSDGGYALVGIKKGAAYLLKLGTTMTGIEEYDDYKNNLISIFPVPFENIITIRSNDSKFIDAVCFMYDMQGKLKSSYKDLNGETIHINAGTLVSGAYLMKIQDGLTGRYFSKVILKE